MEERKKVWSYEELEENIFHRRIVLNIDKLPLHQRKSVVDFKDYQLLKGYTKGTVLFGITKVIQLLKYAQKPAEELTKEDIKNYLVAKNNLNQRTRVRYFTVIKNFIKWLKKEECIADMDIKAPLKIKLPEEILSIDEIKRIIESTTNYRDRALIFTLYETAARSGEILSLKIKHVTFDDNGARILFPNSKTAPRVLRVVRCVPDLRKWIEYHPDKNNPNSPLWINIHCYKEKAVGSSGIKEIVKRAASRAKIKKRVYPHLFRHSRLTELAKRGLNEVQLRIIAGWSKSSPMPEVYVHLSGADVEDKILELEGVKRQECQKESDLLKTIPCWRCGEENSAASRFCSKCGAELDEDKRMRDRNMVVEEIKNVDFNDSEQLKEQIIKLFKKGKLSISSRENLTR